MVRLRLLRQSMGCLLLGLAATGSAPAQGQRVELLLPSDDYHRSDLPADPAGPWWVLHQPDGRAVLEPTEIVVTPFRTCGDKDAARETGREVRVPSAQGIIVLVRGLEGIGPGVVRTAFVDTDGAGAAERVEVPWDETLLVVQRVAEGPDGDQPGQYQIELLLGTQRYQLHTDEWHGDGRWRVRWIGDLNRDSWPDVLLDASHKYRRQHNPPVSVARGHGSADIYRSRNSRQHRLLNVFKDATLLCFGRQKEQTS